MSVEIETSALSMSRSLSLLELTPLPMYRIYIQIPNIAAWYRVINEANTMFGRNWKGQSRVRRRLQSAPQVIWFDVPDETFGTWVAIKHAVTPVETSGK